MEIDDVVYSEAKPLAVIEWGFNEISKLEQEKSLGKHVWREPGAKKEDGRDSEQAAGARQEHLE